MSKSETTNQFDVIVIGAGPAGMMAAITAAQAGASVAMLEQLDEPGRKLLATGGGRCNLTNRQEARDFMQAFGRHGRFIQPALAAMDAAALCEFFDALGVPTACADGMHVFPASNRAGDVRAALWRRCKELGVTIQLGWRAEELVISAADAAPRISGVKTNHGLIAASTVVLASGGKSYPTLGATGAGYELAQSVGHTIVAPVPALVGLVTAERWPASLAGVSLSPARVWIDLPKVGKAGRTGDVLFTHGGISGPAVLDLSGEVSQLLTEHWSVPVRLEVLAGRQRAAWLAELDRWYVTDGTKLVRLMLGASMPAALVQIVLKQAGVDGETRCAHLARPSREAVAAMLGGMELTITRTEGFERAIVTRGGVSLKEVDPRSLQSRLVAGLYFVGEVLDLDGACGGYNLQWAFSSGRLAGQSAISPQRHRE